MRVFFATPASCKFLKRYLDEINFDKKSKVKVQIGKFRDPENEDFYCSHDYRRFVYNFGSVSNFLAARY